MCFIAYLLDSLLEIQAAKSMAGITGTKTLEKLKVLTKKIGSIFNTAGAKGLPTDLVEVSYGLNPRFRGPATEISWIAI